MSYTVEKLEKSQIKLAFDVDAETFAKAVDEAYRKIRHKFAIPGFRKGHAPKKVIEGIYGKEVFFEDAMDIVIPDEYQKALENEKDLEIVAQPELTAFDFKEDGGATFSLTVTVRPEVKLGKYKGLKVAKKAVKITAKDVDAEIESVREKQARIIDKDGEAAMGDIVNIDFVGYADDVAFDGGSADKFDLELGSGSFIPGFEEQLVGVKAGDSKDVNVKFPEEYHAEELKGKEAVFKCTVNAVKAKELPALDDEFAKDVSEVDTLKEYKESVKNKLKEKAEQDAEREFEDAVADAVVANAEVEIPAAMVENEAEDMIQEFSYRLQYQGLKLEDYLKYLNMTREQLADEYKPQAEKSVKVRLVMEEIVKAENIEFTPEEIDEKIAKMAESMNKTAEDFKKELRPEQFEYFAKQILSDKLLDMLKKENAPAAKKEKAEVDDVKTETVEKKPAAKKPAAKKTTKKATEENSDKE